MKISKQARREAKQLFRVSMAKGALDEQTIRTIVRELVSRKPRGYVGILSHLHRLVKLEQERRSARVESAAPLPPDMQSQVKANLERVYGPGLNMTFSQNAALIGGLRIQVGSDVYDGSVQARLAALQGSF